MQEIGKIMHLASSGRVIIKLKEPLPEGQILGDLKSNKIAKVMELIGPTKSPFASASPLTNSIKKYVGRNVFALDVSPARKKTRRKRK